MAARARTHLLAPDGSVLAYLIMRDHLQSLLARALPADCVCFNKKLQGLASARDGNEVECVFEDGQVASFDLVIGCDGVKSLVRCSVPNIQISLFHPLTLRGLGFRV
jgi:2-polyprenyl-6-methoxyphenol hydroxylase-like FAD-dependent oxidoreductase